MSALEPGLYRATVRGVADVIVLIDDNGYGHHTTILGDSRHSGPSKITDARPLIVLDLEDPAEVVRHLRSAHSEWVCLDDIADAIEAQTKPARIPEPGWDGKVLAHTFGDPAPREFVRHGRRPSKDRFNWSDGSGYGSAQWDDLIDPVLIREGVTS